MLTNLKLYSKKTLLVSASLLLIIACESETTRDIEPSSPTTNSQSSTNSGDTTNNNDTISDTENEENTVNDDTNFSSDALELLELVNQERVSRQLQPLTLNFELVDSATKHSIDMKDNIGGLNHSGSDGSSFSERSQRANYKGFARAENIARGQRTPLEVHTAWMNSTTGHRENILLPDITEMGIGRSGNFWTQVFGRN